VIVVAILWLLAATVLAILLGGVIGAHKRIDRIEKALHRQRVVTRHGHGIPDQYVHRSMNNHS